MTEKQKTERRDYVDNAIYKLMVSLNPTTEKVTWDTGTINDVKWVILDYFVEDLKICTQEQFYP